jgi:acyl transferase domain-containing protein
LDSIPESLRNDPLYVGARGIIPNANTLMPFGINPKLAEVMDPQIRLFLEIAWETLEQTGLFTQTLFGFWRLYAGTGLANIKKNILPNQKCWIV